MRRRVRARRSVGGAHQGLVCRGSAKFTADAQIKDPGQTNLQSTLACAVLRAHTQRKMSAHPRQERSAAVDPQR